MNTPLVVANWKSFKNPAQAIDWFEEIIIASKIMGLHYSQKIILCAPFLDLPILSDALKHASGGLTFELGAENISYEEQKPLTGEITPDMIRDFVGYVMIGHSERRINLGETDEMVNKKIKLAGEHGLKLIVCVSSLAQIESIKKDNPDFSDLILYEPVAAIGSGQAENPEEASKMAREIKTLLPNARVLYGGSVNGGNVKDIVSQDGIDGVAVGGASLSPSSFLEIVKNVTTN